MINNKTILTGVAAYYFLHGVVLLFSPESMLDLFHISVMKDTIVAGQFFGGSLIALGYLTWLSRHAVVGGIYGRPLVITNLTFFLVSALTGLNSRLSGFGNEFFWIEELLFFAGTVYFGNLLLSKSPVSN